MSTEKDTTRVVRSWLEEGASALPDRVLDAVLDQLPATHQRRAPLHWRSLGALRLPVFAPAAAALVIAAVMVVTIVPLLGPGGPGLSPRPSPSSSSSPEPSLDIPPLTLTHTIQDLPVELTVRSPSEWATCEINNFERAVCTSDLREGPEVAFQIVDRVPVDPCAPEEGLVELGPTVDDLVEAITGLPGFSPSPVTDITLDGYAGKELTTIAPVGVGCELFVWGNPERMNGVGSTERNLIRIVDVDGTRIMITAAYFPQDGPEYVATLEAIMDSVDFLP
jgi:hypothetical protein